MPLIKVANPYARNMREHVHGMSHTQRTVDMGAPPPVFYPHCRSCGIPPERFTYDPKDMANPFAVPVQAQCHGKTHSRYVPAAEILRSAMTGAPVWFFEGNRGRGT